MIIDLNLNGTKNMNRNLFITKKVTFTLSRAVTTCHLHSYLLMFFKVAYIAYNMDPDPLLPV